MFYEFIPLNAFAKAHADRFEACCWLVLQMTEELLYIIERIVELSRIHPFGAMACAVPFGVNN